MGRGEKQKEWEIVGGKDMEENWRVPLFVCASKRPHKVETQWRRGGDSDGLSGAFPHSSPKLCFVGFSTAASFNPLFLNFFFDLVLPVSSVVENPRWRYRWFLLISIAGGGVVIDGGVCFAVEREKGRRCCFFSLFFDYQQLVSERLFGKEKEERRLSVVPWLASDHEKESHVDGVEDDDDG
ncbi:hypothetical protein L1987_19936 [Smallanthus sonchifolius]|uniref:Uncharacterized protein n=1 Tax=Smallanthus sonchifolius TaxID=185202 RepID=A0ACB9IPY8_9ASTR|nr:hypothetical protein L1987_19936 [Smallanthus sonchifolius]